MLMYNGKQITATAIRPFNTLGLIIDGNNLVLEDEIIATSTSAGTLSEHNGNMYFNEVILSTKGRCINITSSDYNKLLNGELVAGYKSYSALDIYNIVVDIEDAPEITYTIANGVITFSDNTTQKEQSNVLYNNSSDDFTENTLDIEASINSTTPPFVSVRYFNPIVPVGGTIGIEYFVDTYNMASLKHGERSDIFTVILKTKDGREVKKTSYAGFFELETPAFSTEGETWFSIECIDSNNVGSVVQYFDILVRDAVIPNYYQMTEQDLTTYNIVPNNNDPQVAYANKAAISNLFAYAKGAGYDGIVMLKNTYYVDYHHTFGTQTYKKAQIDTSTKKITAIEDCTEQDVIDSGVRRTFKANKFGSSGPFYGVGDSFASTNDDMTRWEAANWIHVVGNNKYIYYVYNTSSNNYMNPTDNVIFPDHFTLDLNGATIKAAPSTDVERGAVILLDHNIDVHIVNGTLEGNFDTYDWPLSCIRIGNNRPAEWLNVETMLECRYCSIRDVNIKYSVGYGSNISGRPGSYRESLTYTPISTITLNEDTITFDNDMVETQLIDLQEYKKNNHEIRLGGGTSNGWQGYNVGNKREVLFVFYKKVGSDYTFVSIVKSKYYFSCKVPDEATHVKVLCYGADSDFVNPNGSMGINKNMPCSVNILMDNIHYSKSATCAIAPFFVKGLCYNNCYFTNIAANKTYKITDILGDFEDGWQHMQNVAMLNCKCDKKDGHDELCIHCCNGLDFSNNEGIMIYMNSGGLEYGFFFNNKMPSYKPIINKGCRNPFVYYKGNQIGELNVTYNGDVSTSKDKTPVDPVIYMEDTTITKFCGYADLKLRNSMNGDVWND